MELMSDFLQPDYRVTPRLAWIGCYEVVDEDGAIGLTWWPASYVIAVPLYETFLANSESLTTGCFWLGAEGDA
jgi:hypothetical protein